MLISLTIANAGLAIATSSLAFSITNYADGYRMKPMTDAWLSVSVANDLAITVSGLLFKSKSYGPMQYGYYHKSPHPFCYRECTFFAIMVLVTFTTLPSTGFHLMFSIPLGRIYTSTLLSTLDWRESLRQEFPALATSSSTRDLGELGLHSVIAVEMSVGLVNNYETEMDSLRKTPRWKAQTPTEDKHDEHVTVQL
ncbi:hypothetical protein C8J57DRAFT_1606983 [Mycena rebaudengoi]|nr:hypothetical protein C8J57DRAFT_1606983 [Mycena rebaudengoi]